MISSETTTPLSNEISTHPTLLPTFQRNHFRKRLDERLPETVSVGALARDHQDVARLDAIPEVAVSPDVAGGAQRAEYEGVSLYKGWPGEIDDGAIVGFEALPSDDIRATVHNDEILRLLVYHGQKDMHGVVDQPAARLSEHIAKDMREDIVSKGSTDLAGKNLDGF